MRDRTEYNRLWHQKNKERRNAAALAKYYADPKPHNARRAVSRASMTEAEREAYRERDRAYRASRKAQDKEYLEKNRERITKRAHETYLRRKKPKRDPAAAAQRLAKLAAAKAAEIVRTGYKGTLKPGGF